MPSLALFITALTGLILSKKLVGDYFSPPAVYHFFWAFALGCLLLDWVAYDPMLAQVWQAIGLAYLGFMGGCAVVGFYALAKPRWQHARPAFQYLDKRRLELALTILFVLGIAGFLFQLLHLQDRIGLGTFVSDPMEAREMHTNVKYLGFFNVLNVANFVLAAMYIALYRRPRKWVVLILIWALATTFLTTDRTRFFYMIIWSFFIGVYIPREVRLTPRVSMSILATVFALFGFFFLIAKVYQKEAFDDNMESVRLSKQYAPLVDPYIYLTGSFPVFQAFLEDDREHTYGKYTFEPVVKVIELFYPWFEREEIVGKFYRVPIELNACTYLEPFYKDYGMAGIVLGPFVLGLMCMWVYVAMRQKKTLFAVYLASLLCFCVTISIFVNHFTQTATWYFILVGYLVHRFCHTTDPQPETEFRHFVFHGERRGPRK